MAQKLLKVQKKKVAPSKDATPHSKKIVLIGTYAGDQLKEWPGYYPYPLSSDDKIDPECCKTVNEIWLFKGTKEPRYFAAECLGVKTREELKSLGYPGKGKGHGDGTYLLFKITKTYAPANASAALAASVESVIVRTRDFARTPTVRKQLKEFLESADRNDDGLASQLPSIVLKLPREVLRVSEAAVQLDFLAVMFPVVDDTGRDCRGDSIEHICKSLGTRYGTPGWPDDFGNALRGFFDQHPGRRIRTLSLFSGAGGLDIGFSDAGFDIVDSVEIEKKFCATLELNSGAGKRFCHSRVNCIDIRKFSGRDLHRIDFIIGGPPCQTFSAAGRRANGVLGTTDARGVLFREYVRLLNELQPRGFLFENVYGITGAQGGDAWREIRESFAAAGYTIFSRILDAADFGVPQHRERLIIVGVRDGSYKFPRPTNGPDSLSNTPYYTAGMAIRGLKLAETEKKQGLGGRFGYLLDEIPPGLNYSYYTKEMGHPRPVFAWRSKFSDFLYKADPEAPVRTIKAQGGAYTGPLHWDNRFFAYSEYKRLQTFPDDYEISGGKQVAVKQIGNSVPPQLARMLALSIQAQLFGAVFPFKISYLEPDDKLTFRSRKLEAMEIYRRKARTTILRLPKESGTFANFSTEFFCRLSDRFKYDKCAPTDGDFKVEVEWDDRLQIRVSDFNLPCDEPPCFTIDVKPSKLTWELPFSSIQMHSYSSRKIAFTVAWKALENLLSDKGLKADLVQLNGYYQYVPELCCKCRFARPFEYADIISGIVAGENVRRIISDAELARAWGVRREEVVDVALELRKIGYEIRNNKTNPQIEPGQWLIPYAFPTLNSMSVQLGKEVK